jgi:hypothetical protein
MPIMRTPEELVTESSKLLARLGRALNSVERNDEGSGAELATVLRILVDSTNRGNRVMVRLAAALRVELPPVFVSGGPARTSKEITLSFGNLPTEYAPSDGQPQTPRWLPFDAWLDADSIVAPRSEKRRLSWRAFITLVANTGGAHLGVEYHDILLTSDRFDAVGLSLEDFFLRQVGWQIERVLVEVLAQSGRPMLPRTRPMHTLSRVPMWMEFRETASGLETAIAVHVSSDERNKVEVMRFDRHGQTHHLFHNGGIPGGGLDVQYVIDDSVSGRTITSDALEGLGPPWL